MYFMTKNWLDEIKQITMSQDQGEQERDGGDTKRSG